jgi:hypothetical protein
MLIIIDKDGNQRAEFTDEILDAIDVKAAFELKLDCRVDFYQLKKEKEEKDHYQLML